MGLSFGMKNVENRSYFNASNFRSPVDKLWIIFISCYVGWMFLSMSKIFVYSFIVSAI